MNKINQILDYWFEGISDETTVSYDTFPGKKWFMKIKKVDEEIRKKFEPDILKAREGQYKDWEDDAKGRLALIILFDQFCRNIYRDQLGMFESDPIALDLTLRSIDDRMEVQLSLIERVFLYMPLMHSEDMKIQKLSMESFENLLKEAKEKQSPNVKMFTGNVDYAHRHFKIVERFGRYPHRNAILNRKSTPEEVEFLKQPNSSF